MSVEISNFVHAIAVVSSDGLFLANQGFAAMGSNPVQNSRKTATGRFVLRLLPAQGIAFADGEGAPLCGIMPRVADSVQPYQSGAVASYDPSDPTIVNVETQIAGEDADVQFFVIVLRSPQVSTH